MFCKKITFIIESRTVENDRFNAPRPIDLITLAIL